MVFYRPLHNKQRDKQYPPKCNPYTYTNAYIHTGSYTHRFPKLICLHTIKKELHQLNIHMKFMVWTNRRQIFTPIVPNLFYKDRQSGSNSFSCIFNGNDSRTSAYRSGSSRFFDDIPLENNDSETTSLEKVKGGYIKYVHFFRSRNLHCRIQGIFIIRLYGCKYSDIKCSGL